MDSSRETGVVYDEKTHKTPDITKTSDFIGSKDAKDDKFREKPYETEVHSSSDEEGRGGEVNALETAEDIVTAIIDVSDDPTLNPWTFRMFFIGLCNILIIHFLNTNDVYRFGLVCLWSCTARNFLLQASNHLCISQ